MKPVIATVALLATISTANPEALLRRQIGGGSTSNDLTSGSCKDVIFIFARGSTEPGNMGSIIGPGVCSGLKQKLPGKVECQGVGGAYKAAMADNRKAQYTAPEAIQEAVKMFKMAAQKCPNSKVTFGGYSQGGAVMHGAVSSLDKEAQSKLVGGVLFGDSMNGKHSGTIPNYPKDRVKELCNSGDGICARTISGITAAHLSYGRDGSAGQAVDFLVSKINSYG